MGVAGVYDVWRGPDGVPLYSVAVITVPANDVAAEVHHRMPAVLPRESFDAWLDTVTAPEEAHELLAPTAAGTIERVSPDARP